MYVQRLLQLCLTFSLLFFVNLSYAEDDESAEGAEAPAGPTTLYKNLEPDFTVNYGGTGRLRYLKTDISLRVKTKSMSNIDAHEIAIRHIIVMMLSRQLDEDVSSSEGREMIKQGILAEIQDFMQKETGEQAVTDVLFNSFVVQK